MSKGQNLYVGQVDGEKAWWEGWGWLGRWRAIYPFTGLNGVAIYKIASRYPWYVPMVFGTIALSALVGMYALRVHRLRSFHVWKHFHALCHNLRNECGMLRASVLVDFSAYRERFQTFHGKAANLIAEFFRALARDETINCAIRLASVSDGNARSYVTRGRSDRMDPSREVNTCPLSEKEGIAKKLMDESQIGVYLIGDVAKAVMDGWWQRHKNDRLEDARRFMVAPINCPNDDGVREMLGILYVTAKDRCFGRRHVEPMRGVADLLGMLYRSIAFEPYNEEQPP